MNIYRVWNCESEVVVDADSIQEAVEKAMEKLKFAPIGVERINYDG